MKRTLNGNVPGRQSKMAKKKLASHQTSDEPKQYKREYNNLPFAQRGLFDCYHKYGIFVCIKQRAVGLNQRKVLGLFKNLYEEAINMAYRTYINIAFSPNLWRQWTPGKALEQRPNEDYLINITRKFVNTGGDIFFYIKSNEKGNSDKIYDELYDQLLKIGLKETDLSVTKSNEYGNTGIINGSFREGLANLSDRCSVDRHILVGEIDKGEKGSTYMMTQKFRTAWEILEYKSQSTKERMIGRKMYKLNIIPTFDKSSHIQRGHTLDEFPPPCNVSKGLRRIHRQSMPYGTCESHPGREEGAFFIACAKSMDTFTDILANITGCPGTTYDAFLDVFSAIEGSFWYVPNIQELNLSLHDMCSIYMDIHWVSQQKPNNKYLFYNQKQYLHDMDTDVTSYPDGVSSTVLALLQYTFEQWNNVWFQKVDVPDIPALSQMLQDDEISILQESVPLRKGLAVKKCLGELFTTADIRTKIKEPSTFYGWKADLFNIHPDEIIVGRMPKGSTLGLGKKVMKYLNEEERIAFYLLGLSESSSVGHVIPDHGKLLKLGVSGLISDMKQKLTTQDTIEKQHFFKSCIMAVEGVQLYISNFGRLAGYLSELKTEYSSKQRNNLIEINKRMLHLSNGKPRNFTEATQLIFSMHCCLHLIGQPVAVGRLDELLAPYLLQRNDSLISYQEVIDCFWIKFGERVILDPHNATDVTSWGNCAVPYSSDGTFPRGDSLNQWVQQVTVGGYHESTNEQVLTAMKDVTILCLRAARRLPLNAPCLSLRLHKGMDEQILQEAAKALLSGGAHPILLHDDRIIPALKSSPRLQSTVIPDSDINNYACDGCYEPLIAGKSEFTFTYIPLPKIVELAINQGDTYVSAGPSYLQGQPSSYRSVPASAITSFHQLQEVFNMHLKVQTEAALYKLLTNYGNIWKACPAPLLSSVIDGCLETGRDLYNGGAKYHIAACMFIGFSNCVDSLYSIQRLCFDPTSACVSLEELLIAMKNDWGFDMVEPFVDDNAGIMRTAEKSTFYKSLRDRVLAFPKFGTDAGADEHGIQELTEWLANQVISTFHNVVNNSSPTNPLFKLFERLKADFSTTEAPFDCLLCPGSGTFEGYVGWGTSLGASADGRRKLMPIASDFSAAPVIQDGPCRPTQNNIYKSMKNWDYDTIKNKFSNGAEVDLNIHENFPEDELVSFLRKYADGEGIGANIITVTCADEDTYKEACADSEKYDLLRVRMGGWSEHFVSMFKAHQKQHRRRAYYLPPSQMAEDH